MSKAIQGVAMLGAAVADGVAMFAMASTGVGAAALPFMMHAMEALVVGGLSMEAAAVASSLESNRGTGLTMRQSAAYRQVIRGTQRVGGTILYRSTTGSSRRQLNYVIVLAGHVCWAITGLYLDGRLVNFTGEGDGWTAGPGGIYFGGNANGNTYTGPNGVQYNFGGLVYCEARYGTQAEGDVIGGLTANDPTWAARNGRSPFVGGCTYVYLKVEGDASMFPQEPEIRFTVMGKPIYDPRSQETSYSDNWALNVADHLADPVFGLGDPYINEEQLIAAANICDEQIETSQGYEANYALHWHYDTSMSPGNALVTMMEGIHRVRQIGGEWYIFPAAWIAPSASFDHGYLAGGIDWNPVAGIDALCNVVQGTYIAPNYPYNIAGNLYDSNGFYDGQIQNNWNFAFQPTNFPPYARDTAHGYAANEDLNLDSGVLGPWSGTQTYNEGDACTYNGAIWKSLVDGNLNNAPQNTDDGEIDTDNWVNGALYLPKDVQFQTCLSIVQAQRMAKILLMRTRFMGKGRLPMMLPAVAMQSLDVMEFTAPELGWTAKVLEIDQPVLRAVETRLPDGSDGPPALQVLVPIAETDPSIYEWETSEEQTIYAAQATPQSASGAVAPPTDLTLVSSAATALVQPDGSVLPRIEVSWATPEDQLATGVLVRYRLTPSGGTTPPWITAATVDISLNSYMLGPVVAGQSYDVQIATVRSQSGAQSAWVELDGFVASLLYSTASTEYAIGQNALIGQGNSDGTASIIIEPFTAQIGARQVSYLAGGSVEIDGLVQQQLYYVWVQDPTAAGGNLTPVATTTNEYAGQLGWWLIGTITTPYQATGGTGSSSTRYAPTSYSDTGTRTTVNPAAAYDGNASSCARVTSQATSTETPLRHNFTWGNCTWSGMSGVTTAAMTLSVTAAVPSVTSGSATLEVTVGSTTTTLLNATAATALATYTLAIPSGTDLSTVSINAQALATLSGSPPETESAEIDVYEIVVA